jgi:hypothetical protein
MYEIWDWYAFRHPIDHFASQAQYVQGGGYAYGGSPRNRPRVMAPEAISAIQARRVTQGMVGMRTRDMIKFFNDKAYWLPKLCRWLMYRSPPCNFRSRPSYLCG